MNIFGDVLLLCFPPSVIASSAIRRADSRVSFPADAIDFLLNRHVSHFRL